MKFTMGSLVTAALATVASSAVVARRATALPASFGLEFVSSDAAINGVRVKYSEGRPQLGLGIDAVFRGGADRVFLDETVHTTDEPATEWIQYDTSLYPAVFLSARGQALIIECGEDCNAHFTPGGFSVVDGKLNHVSLYDGVTPESYWAVCGHKAGALFWWDRLAFWTSQDVGCSTVEFKIVEL